MAQAHYLVAKRASGWFITMEGERYGPFTGGRIGAVTVAVQAAQQAGKDGHNARVHLRDPDGSVRTVWTFGVDSYPPRWSEQLRDAALPRRDRVPPPPRALKVGTAP